MAEGKTGMKPDTVYGRGKDGDKARGSLMAEEKTGMKPDTV